MPDTPDLSIAPDRIHWRIIASTRGDPPAARVAPYIDARDVMEKLDELDPHWSDAYRQVGTNGVECCITVGGVTRCDVGVERAGRSDSPEMAPIKAAYSDALKRAAVKFGIGRELYNLPEFYCPGDYIANGKVKSVKALPRWDAGAGRWLPAVGGWIRSEDSAQLVEGDADPATAEAAAVETDPAPRQVDQRTKRAARVERLRELEAQVGALDSRTVNAYSIRNHVKKLGWDGIGTLPQLYAHGTIEQLDEIGRYIAGKVAEAREDNQAAETNGTAPRAEDMSEEDALAAGRALLGGEGY